MMFGWIDGPIGARPVLDVTQRARPRSTLVGLMKPVLTDVKATIGL